MESQLGHDFSRVRIFADRVADASARGLDALAYTAGKNIVFQAGQYAPATIEGRRLLAHELVHVVQQERGSTFPGVSHPTDVAEHLAEDVATSVTSASGPQSPGRISLAPAIAPRYASVQRQYYPGRSAATTSNPNALIQIADFIRYVEIVERAYGTAPPEEILTRIRQQYYTGLGFNELIPDAPRRRLAPAYAQPPAGGTPIYYENNLSEIAYQSATADAYQHLTAHADENAIQDNPSPYIVMPDGSRIDAGHLLLGLDSLLHPRVEEPYVAYGIPGIDPAGFAADLALASFWTTYHVRNMSPAPDAPIKPATADFDAYYRASAPDEDLLGDIDAFGLHQQWNSAPAQKLSQVLRAYYLGTTTGGQGTKQRYRGFCARNSLSYTVAGGTITWSTAAIEAMWLPRINRLCDLFDSGTFSRIGSVTVGSSPSRGTWPNSQPALQRFLAWLKPRLEAEIAANP